MLTSQIKSHFQKINIMIPEKNKRVNIIGGGVGGLAVGCYLQMNGYLTTIFEKNSECGGVSFAWKRGGYTFDGATNWLAGSSDSSNMHYLLKELINFDELELVDPDVFITVEHDGQAFHVFTDANELYNEMTRIAPEDGAVIEQFTNAIKKVGTFSLPYQKAPELFNLADLLLMLFTNFRFALFFAKWKRLSIEQFASKFTNANLKKMFLSIFPHHGHFSVFSVLMTLGWMNVRSGGYPLGGSSKFNTLLLNRYNALGGQIKYNTSVVKIETENNRAVGVKCSDGNTYNADIIVSAMDLYHTLYRLLEFDKNYYKSINFDSVQVFPSLIQVSIGCRREFTNVSHKYQMALDKKIVICHEGAQNEELSDMMVRICSFDKTLAPSGCTSIVVHFRTWHYSQWVDLRKTDIKRYKKLKNDIAESVIDTLESRFGNVRNNVEQVDVATPATFIRYTNIFKGSYQAWAPVPRLIGKTFPKKVKKVKNLYFAGQWVWPAGGLPGVIRIGRQVAQIICHDDKRKFCVKGD